VRSLGSEPKADRLGRASWSDARFVAAEKPIASRTLADRSVLALQRGFGKWLQGGIDADSSKGADCSIATGTEGAS
jgi:hypothetical protein